MPAKKKPGATAGPKPKFTLLGKSKFVHTVRTKAWDLKHSECQQVRKHTVAETVNYKKTLSAEAALALDSCPQCCTHEVIGVNQTPEQKREARKAARDDVLERARGEKKGKGKKAIKEGGDKPSKPKKASMTKSGPRSTASRAEGDPTTIKAKLLADYAVECGWSSDIGTDDDTGHTVVVATKGDATINAWFIDGKYDINRHAEIVVGSWTGKLRGAHACRRQMSGENPVHPDPGKGRSGPRKRRDEDDVQEDESPVDAMRRLPFSLDDPDIEIIDKVKGQIIRWRNGQSNVIEEAWLPSVVKPKKAKREVLTITTHPKTERRMLTFLTVASVNEHGEQYGPERSVYIDKIVRVVAA
jgi:hypothetical protein